MYGVLRMHHKMANGQTILLLLFHPKNSFIIKKYFWVIVFLWHTKLFNIDVVTNENNAKKSKVSKYSRPPIELLIVGSYESGKKMNHLI